MKLVHFDCDVDGSASIAHLIPDYVQSFKINTYPDAEGIVWAIKRGQIQCNMVVFDTVTGFVSRLRDALVYDPTMSGSGTPIWDNRKKLKADWDHFRGTSDLSNRIFLLMMTLSDIGVPCIFICHEKSTEGMKSRVDPLSGEDKIIPNLQAGINECLYANSSAIVRLTNATLPFEYEGLAYPRGTRILVLNPTGESSAGMRVDWSRPVPPTFIPIQERDPYAFSRFVQIMGRVPQVTLLYGPPKIGKTTFAAGAVYL
jgi:hypothetical protein